MKTRMVWLAALVVVGIALGAWWILGADHTTHSAAMGSVSEPEAVSPAAQTVLGVDDSRAGSGAVPPNAGSSVSRAASSPVMRGNAAPPAAQSPAVASGVAATPPPNRDPTSDLDKVHHMITDYHTLMGENPVGTNAEIMQAVMGANRNQASIGPPEGQALNDKGELVDRWGTPYFFHQLSKDVMEIRSAGPDKVMGTTDDLMMK